MLTYVTFGQEHVHDINGIQLNKNTVAVIKCSSARDGRDKAFDLFGPFFFTTYYDTEWKAEKLEWFPEGLKHLP